MFVGTFMTALDMAGFSLSVLVLDDERISALDANTQVCHHSHVLSCPDTGRCCVAAMNPQPSCSCQLLRVVLQACHFWPCWQSN